MSDGTFAQTTYRMDRYNLDRDQVNTLTIEFQNTPFAFNRFVMEMPYPDMTPAIEKITVSIGSTVNDLWLTADSALFFTAQNPQTAWINRPKQRIEAAFIRNILPGETVKIIFSLRLHKRIMNDEKLSGLAPIILSVYHADQADQQIRFLPAMNMTLKP